MTPSKMSRDTRPISWIAPARKTFEAFPDGVQDEILNALTIAAEARKADIAKPLTGFGPGVLEIALKHRSNAYRAVYAVKIDRDIWVVHAFKKKSSRGIKTSKKDLDLIRKRIERLKRELQE